MKSDPGHALILTGGRLDLQFAKDYLQKSDWDFLIVVDGGAHYALQLGLSIDAAVGDFDTLSREEFALLSRDPGIAWDIHIPQKDETDTELAIYTAEKLGVRKITILGATGGRIDHELSNLHMLAYCLERGIEAELVDPQNRISLFRDRKVFDREQTYGKYISFIPLTERVEGLTLTGFLYPLQDKTLSIGIESGRCVSNELAGEKAEASLKSGILICIESRDRKE